LKREVVLKHIAIKQPSATVIWHKDGSFNFADLIPAASPAAEKKTELPGIYIEHLDITGGAFEFLDQRLPEPARMKLDQINVALQNVSTVSNAPVATAISFRVNDAGNISITGTNTLIPVTADLRIVVDAMALAPFQPYVRQQANLALTGGAVNVTGQVSYRPPQAQFTGDVAVMDFATVDGARTNDLVQWAALAVTGIEADLAPMKVRIGEVRLKDFTANAEISADGKLNFKEVMPASAAQEKPEAAASAKTALPEIRIDAVVLENSAVRVADESVQPNFRAAIEELAGTVKGLSSLNTKRADVDLRGRIGRAPFSITGQINPLTDDLYTDLAVVFREIVLAPASPYAGKFAGYPIENGTLSLDLRYHVSQKELKGENRVLVDKLTLGEHTGSPDATKLPVKLALALLTDRHGRMDLNLPVRGRLDDPKFKIGGVILQVLQNILVKAATSPFALLGSVFGGGEDLGFVAFDPGNADWKIGEGTKLDTLAKALVDRPALTLEITGSADPVADRETLARHKMLAALKTARADELAAAGQRPPKPELLTLDKDDHQRLVRLAFARLPGLPKELRSLVISRSGRPLMSKAGKPISSRSSGDAPAAVEALTLERMETEIIKRTPVIEAELQTLAQARAKKVHEYLRRAEGLTGERLVLVAGASVQSNALARVNFSLK
jgi:hypothetical protein